MQNAFLFPFPFWLSILAMLGFGFHAWKMRYHGWGIPMIAVLGTVAAWYVGDVFYNNYADIRVQIGDSNFEAAWWEVALFVVAFGCLVPQMHRAVNRKILRRQHRGSQIFAMMRGGGIYRPSFQQQVDLLGRGVAFLWAILMFLALIRTDFDFLGLFMPYLGDKAYPWSRGRLGGGIDALLVLGSYFQVLITAAAGVVAALAVRKQTRYVAIAIYFLTIPSYIFDRTRNTMLATLLPGLLAWTFLRFRGSLVARLLVLGTCFLVLNSWMKFVIQNRSTANIALAMTDKDRWDDSKEAKHLGLNMFEELSWVNSFIETGAYRPNWGQRYFAEIVNPIPRVLWPGKPMIGIDYALLRGQGFDQAESSEAGVGATISTGMIGQGVVNFGRIFGPLAVALIMACWVALLARLDLLGNEMGRLLLYVVGLILTFNLGRDITLVTLYPFCFGYLILYYQKKTRKPAGRSTRTSVTSRS